MSNKPPADPVELARSVTTDVFDVLLDVMSHPEATHANVSPPRSPSLFPARPVAPLQRASAA